MRSVAHGFSRAIGDRFRLRPQITPALLARVKDDINTKVGTFETVTAVHHLTQDGFPHGRADCEVRKALVSVRVTPRGQGDL